MGKVFKRGISVVLTVVMILGLYVNALAFEVRDARALQLYPGSAALEERGMLASQDMFSLN